jgi:hypothetical protein
VTVIIDAVWIGNQIYRTLLHTTATSLYKLSSHKGQSSQSQSSLLCLVTSSNSQHSSTPRLTTSQVGGLLTPTSYPSEVSGLSHNGSRSSYCLSTDHIENINSNSYATVVCTSCMDHTTTEQMFSKTSFQSHSLQTSVPSAFTIVAFSRHATTQSPLLCRFPNQNCVCIITSLICYLRYRLFFPDLYIMIRHILQECAVEYINNSTSANHTTSIFRV